MKILSNELTKLANRYRDINVSIEEVIAITVEECAALCERHANELETFDFDDKANTARSLAGILREHFELPHTLPKR